MRKIFRKTLSLTTRLTLWYTLSSLSIVLAATLYPYWSWVQALEDRDERFLKAREDAVRALLAIPDQGRSLHFRVTEEWPTIASEVFFVRVEDEKGKLLVQSPEARSLINTVFGKKFRSSSEVFDKKNVRGKVYRTLSSKISEDGRSYYFQIALDRTSETASLQEYRYRLFIVLGLCLVAFTIVCFQIARRGLLPVKKMTQTAANINSSNLDERMSLEEVPSELAHLASTFNEMLERLKASFERLQRFSADIAHEIRTPINNISGELQVALRKERHVSFYKEAMGSALEECSRISRIVDSLLFLARAENPVVELNKTQINVKKELCSALEFYEPAATEAGIQCKLEADGNLEIFVERTLFQRAVGNLLSNAIRKTPRGGEIKIIAHDRGKFVELEVRDTGIGIASEHLPYIFDRFYRIDPSRSKDEGGEGLGLAIVKSIATIHGGEVRIASAPGRGTRVSLSFPVFA